MEERRMARKWERMIEKNRKTINKRNVKTGKPVIAQAGAETMTAYKGRSWMLPLLLVGFAVFYLVAFSNIYHKDTSYWVTAVGYIALGAMLYLSRRPVLRIGKSKLSTRRFSGDRTVGADEIEEILLSPSYVVIQMKEKKTRWIFSRLTQLMPMAALTPAVREFAERNQIELKVETK
jgi:hypothetical protein